MSSFDLWFFKLCCCFIAQLCMLYCCKVVMWMAVVCMCMLGLCVSAFILSAGESVLARKVIYHEDTVWMTHQAQTADKLFILRHIVPHSL